MTLRCADHLAGVIRRLDRVRSELEDEMLRQHPELGLDAFYGQTRSDGRGCVTTQDQRVKGRTEFGGL